MRRFPRTHLTIHHNRKTVCDPRYIGVALPDVPKVGLDRKSASL